MKLAFPFLALLLAAGQAWSLPAFPGAEGWGADTPGGRGGKVYIVKNTKASGPGSFMEAVSATGPRIVVFEVSGVIEMPDLMFEEKHSNLTIAGQTSPGGITLVKNGGTILESYRANFHDAVFRFLRVRGTKSNGDAVGFTSVHHLVLDHCDFSGGSDETFDVGASHHFTVQWCTITNSSEGQTYGQINAYPPTNFISIHHNLNAHHNMRCAPRMHWDNQPVPEYGMIDYRNNVLYDSRYSRFMDVDGVTSELRFNMVGNYFKSGPSTDIAEILYEPVRLPTITNVYLEDNVHDRSGALVAKVLMETYDKPTKAAKAWETPSVTTYSAKQAYEQVLIKVGAWPRDAMNLRTIDEVKKATGTLRVNTDALLQAGPAAPADGDQDGIPDYFETAMGWKPADAKDNSDDHDQDGYTNIEEYINDLASVLIGEAPQNKDKGIESHAPGKNTGVRVEPKIRKGRGSIRMTLPPGLSRGELVVSDSHGREMARIPMTKETMWDARDGSGRALPPGFYSLQLRNRDVVLGTSGLILDR